MVFFFNRHKILPIRNRFKMLAHAIVNSFKPRIMAKAKKLANPVFLEMGYRNDLVAFFDNLRNE